MQGKFVVNWHFPAPALCYFAADLLGNRSVTRPLLKLLPSLADDLTVQPLAELPTPVEPLAALGENAWIKRDDLSHPEYGGNKIRKLEFILADAIAQGKNHIITFGAIGTNHGVATAMLCQKLGLRCTVLLFDQPLSSTVQKNLQLMAHYGARLQYCGSLGATVARYFANPSRLSAKSYFLFAGGSNPMGTLGFVNAALELKEQVDQGDCPEPAEIVVPVGSSATLAGLTIGVTLAGLQSRVRGIRVAPSHLGPFAACTVATVEKLMADTRKLLKRYGVSVIDVPPPVLEQDYYGDGYGVATEEGEQAKQRFAQLGIELEQTYTAKAAAAFLATLDSTPGSVLFWQTFNSRPLPGALGWQGVPGTLLEKLGV